MHLMIKKYTEIYALKCECLNDIKDEYKMLDKCGH